MNAIMMWPMLAVAQKVPGPAQAPTPPAIPTPPSPDVLIGVPGSAQFDPNFLAQRAENIAVTFFVAMAFIIVGLPIARAFARRMDRGATRGMDNAIPADLSERLTRIEQAVDSIALEVERVSEGQRFTTKLLSEQNAPALPISKESR